MLGVTTGSNLSMEKGGVNIGGATSSSYTIAATVAADAGNYDVVGKRNMYSCVNKRGCDLNSKRLASDHGQPVASQAICEGSSATFTVTATGTGINLSMEKERSRYRGSYGSKLHIPATVTADAGTYTVVVSGTCTPRCNEHRIGAYNQ
jgi:hypothetical protein